MPFLQIAETEIPIASNNAAKRAPERIGSSQRMFAGNLRTAVRVEKRSWSATTKMLTEAEAVAIEKLVAEGVFVLCSGDLLGSTRTEEDLLSFEPGDDLTTLGAIYSRPDASTCATYFDINGVMQLAAANVPRDAHYIDGVRYYLKEPTSTNYMTKSKDFNHANWTKTNVTVTLNAARAPDGTFTANKVAATASAATNMHQSNTTISSTTVVLSCFGRRGSGDTDCQFFAIHNVTTSATIAIIRVNWATGVTTLHSGTAQGHGAVYYPKYGYWRVWVSVNTGVTAGDDMRGYYGFVGNSETAGEYAYLWGAMLEPGIRPTTFIPTDTVAVTRASESFRLPFDHVPQQMTIYTQGLVLDNPATAAAGDFGVIFIGGSGAGATARLATYRSTSVAGFLAFHDPGVAVATASVATAAVWRDALELRQVLFDTGITRLGASINGGAEATADSTAQPLAATWNDEFVWLGSLGSTGTYDGAFAFRKVVIAAGDKSLAEMQGGPPVLCEVTIGDSPFTQVSSGVRRTLQLNLKEV